MSGIISFLIGCVMLAICLFIGVFVLQFMFGIGMIILVSIIGGISWLWSN